MRQETADRLHAINHTLTGLYIELSEIRKAESQAFDSGYHDGGETTAAGKKAVGRRIALEHHLDGLGISGKIQALQEERDYLRFNVEHGYG